MGRNSPLDENVPPGLKRTVGSVDGNNVLIWHGYCHLERSISIYYGMDKFFGDGYVDNDKILLT